jgi:hypothetical protein
MRKQPTKDLILSRLRVKIDGRPGGSARAVGPKGRPVFTSGRRGWAVEHALMWKALGYDKVEVSFMTPQSPRPRYKPFPATQDEAIQCIRELARGRLGGRWRRLLKRIDTSTDDPQIPTEETK